MKLDLKEKLSRLLKPKGKTQKINVPESWVKGKQAVTLPKGKDMVSLELVRKKKYRVPGLRIFNQGLAVVLIIINFFVSQAALMSMTPEVGLLFLGNTYVIIWGLWKSRKERKQLEV